LRNDAAIRLGRIVDDRIEDLEVTGLAGPDHRVRLSVLALWLVKHFLQPPAEWSELLDRIGTQSSTTRLPRQLPLEMIWYTRRNVRKYETA
jgi:hypothetical protein